MGGAFPVAIQVEDELLLLEASISFGQKQILFYNGNDKK